MTASAPGRPPRAISPAYVAALVPAAAALNIVGGTINTALGLPTFLDMVGTCVAAIVLGPWLGALAGALSNVVGGLLLGPTNVPFALVNIAGALVWGYGIRRWRLGRNPVAFFGLNVLVALITTLVAAPIVVLVYGGATGHPSDLITFVLVQSGLGLYGSVLTSNLLVTLADKVISGYLGLAIVAALPPAASAGLVLPSSTPRRSAIVAAVGILVGIVLVLAFRLLPTSAA